MDPSCYWWIKPQQFLRASSANSIRQAKIAFHLGQGDRSGASSSDIVQSLFGQIEVLEIAEVLDYRLLQVRFLAASGALARALRRCSMSSGRWIANMPVS
jgi:hypothetical protein